MPPVPVNPRAALREQRPDSWIPVEPGDFITGIVEEVTSSYSDVQLGNGNNGYYPLIRIQVHDAPGYDPGKVLAVHCFSSILQDRILEQQPVPLERLKITYEGQGDPKWVIRNPAGKIEGRPYTSEADAVKALADGAYRPGCKVFELNPPQLYKVQIIGRDPKLVAERAYAGMTRQRGARRPATAQELKPGEVQAGDEIPWDDPAA